MQRSKHKNGLANHSKTERKAYGLHDKRFKNLTSAYLANKKLIRFAMASLSVDEFEKIIKKKLRQIPGDHCAREDLMYQDIESRVLKLNNEKSLLLWTCVLNEGIVPAIKKLYLYKL